MRIWSPAIALQEEIANQYMLLISETYWYERNIKKQFEL